jgi:hypothetical protein
MKAMANNEGKGIERTHCITERLYNGTKVSVLCAGRIMKTLINQGIRQGCSLCPTLFNTHTDNVIQEWQKREAPGIYAG